MNKDTANEYILISALALSLSFGFLDIYIGLKFKAPKILPLSNIIIPFAVTTGVYLLTFLVLWYALASRAIRRFNLEALPSALSIGVLLGTGVVLISANYKTITTIGIHEKVTMLFLFSAISIVAMLLSYLALRKILEIQNLGKTALKASLLIPLILFEILVFTYLKKNVGVSVVTYYAGLTLTVLCTIAILYFIYISRVRALSTLTALTVLLVIGGPIVVLIDQNITNPKRNESYQSPGVTQQENAIKHVILITVDTLRSDVLSAYGSRAVSTPSIDGFAADGVIFKNAYSSAPWTLPSFSSIMTGLPPGTHLTTTAKSKLPKNFKTTAEYMFDSGYHTTAFVRNLFLHPEFNIDQGFIDYYHYPQSNKLLKSFGTVLILGITNHKEKVDVSTVDITNMSIDWLKNNRDKDFFLWVHYFDPHIPYTPPGEYMADRSDPPKRIGMSFRGAKNIRSGHLALTSQERQWVKKLYDAEVRYVDDNLGRLFEYLKSSGMYDDSLIVLTSDHGEEFWDHGGFEHGHTLYNELLHVPLIIKMPESNDGKEENRKVSTQSIMRTILDACGIGYDEEGLIAGSLYPVLAGKSSEITEEPIVSTGLLYYENRVSVIYGDTKYIRSLVTNQEELYDLALDPYEKQTLIEDSSQDDAVRAKGILKRYNDRTKVLSKRHGVEKAQEAVLSKEKKEKLKALDYIQ